MAREIIRSAFSRHPETVVDLPANGRFLVQPQSACNSIPHPDRDHPNQPGEKHMNEERSAHFQNYAVLTGSITSIERKQDKTGNPYARAQALIRTEYDRDPLCIKIVALNGSVENLKEGDATLVGRLAYEEHSGPERTSSGLILFLHRAEPIPEDGTMRNFLLLTLRIGKEPETNVSKQGKLWGHARAALGQGKDENGTYKPSLWLDLKAFTHHDGDRTAPLALGSFHKGDLVNVSGRISHKVHNGRPHFALIANKIEPLEPIPFPDPAKQ
jgi:hypothetical protein